MAAIVVDGTIQILLETWQGKIDQARVHSRYVVPQNTYGTLRIPQSLHCMQEHSCGARAQSSSTSPGAMLLYPLQAKRRGWLTRIGGSFSSRALSGTWQPKELHPVLGAAEGMGMGMGMSSGVVWAASTPCCTCTSNTTILLPRPSWYLCSGRAC